MRRAVSSTRDIGPATRGWVPTMATTAALLLLAGCSGGSGDRDSSAPRWDPCKAFPAAAMQHLGFDYKSTIESPGRECGWTKTSSPPHSLTVMYIADDAPGNSWPIDRSRDWRSATVSLSEIEVGPYDGYRYRSKDLDPNSFCNIRLKITNSYVVFSFGTGLNPEKLDPCPLATQVANELEPYLPRPAG